MTVFRAAYENWGVWVYRTRWTSGVGGTTGITHDLAAGPGNMIHITQARASAVIAATGTLDIDVIDEDAVIIVKLVDLAAAAAPSATIPRANVAVDSTTSSLLGSSLEGVWLAGTDIRFRITPGNLAAADTVDLQVVARVQRAPGGWTTTSTGLYTEAETQDEVF
jgi:hypothetical protein